MQSNHSNHPGLFANCPIQRKQSALHKAMTKVDKNIRGGSLARGIPFVLESWLWRITATWPLVFGADTFPARQSWHFVTFGMSLRSFLSVLRLRATAHQNQLHIGVPLLPNLSTWWTKERVHRTCGNTGNLPNVMAKLHLQNLTSNRVCLKIGYPKIWWVYHHFPCSKQPCWIIWGYRNTSNHFQDKARRNAQSLLHRRRWHNLSSLLTKQ